MLASRSSGVAALEPLREPGVNFEILCDYGRVLFAVIGTDLRASGVAAYDLAPDDAAVGGTGVRTRRLVVVADALYAFIGIDVVSPLAAWVVGIVHDRAYGAFVDTRAAADANIGDFYSHFFSFIKNISR
jgi:hypothetical protein